MGQCKDCKWWGGNKVETRKDRNYQCDRDLSDGCKFIVKAAAALLTEAEFGCVEFEKT